MVAFLSVFVLFTISREFEKVFVILWIQRSLKCCCVHTVLVLFILKWSHSNWLELLQFPVFKWRQIVDKKSPVNILSVHFWQLQKKKHYVGSHFWSCKQNRAISIDCSIPVIEEIIIWSLSLNVLPQMSSNKTRSSFGKCNDSHTSISNRSPSWFLLKRTI